MNGFGTGPCQISIVDLKNEKDGKKGTHLFRLPRHCAEYIRLDIEMTQAGTRFPSEEMSVSPDVHAAGLPHSIMLSHR